MIRIELRSDGWFEAGKDAEKTFPVAYEIYRSKQKIKKALEKIGEPSSIEDLAGALVKIPEERPYYKGQPFLREKEIFILTSGLPGEYYLGSITE